MTSDLQNDGVHLLWDPSLTSDLACRPGLDLLPTVRVSCVSLARLWYPVVWSSSSLDVAVKGSLDVITI